MTTEQKQKATWMNRLFLEEKKLAALEDYLQHEKEKAVLLDGKNPESRIIGKLSTEEKCDAERKKVRCIRDEIETAIEQLQDPELEAILIRRYLNFEPIETIAENIGYHERTVQRKHLIALDKVVTRCH